MARQFTKNLRIPIPDEQDTPVDFAELYAQMIQIVDGMDHSEGKGLPIPSDRVDFTSDQNVNNKRLSNVKSQSFAEQPVDSETVPIRSMYEEHGELFWKDGRGRKVQITKEGDVVNRLININTGTATSVLKGFTPHQANRNRDVEAAKTAALAAYNAANPKVSQNINTLLIGGRVTFDAPAAGRLYWPWLAIKNDDISNTLLFYDEEFNNETNYWVSVQNVDNAGTSYRLYVRRVMMLGNTHLNIILRTFT